MRLTGFVMTSWLLALVILTASRCAEAAILINEISVDPPGGDDHREFIEIISTTGQESLVGVWLISLESDTNRGNRGVVDNAIDLSSAAFGPNDLLLLGEDYTFSNPWNLTASDAQLFDLRPASRVRLENESVHALVRNFTGSVGDDLDDNDDNGLNSLLPWDEVLDAVAITDIVNAGTPSDDYFGVTPRALDPERTVDALVRWPEDTRPLSTDAWYGGVLSEDLVFSDDPDRVTANFPLEGMLTPGRVNPPLEQVDDLQGDFNANGQVEQSDLDLVLLHWGESADPAPFDWVADLPQGSIDQDELDRVLLHWGDAQQAALATALPEPSSLILGLILLALLSAALYS